MVLNGVNAMNGVNKLNCAYKLPYTSGTAINNTASLLEDRANVEEAFLSIGRMVTEHQFQV